MSLTASPEGAEVVITDDGRGFEPEEELVRAARGGHLGLVGMHERVRMLGGLTSIDSRPGGPTTISAQIPPAASRYQRRTLKTRPLVQHEG